MCVLCMNLKYVTKAYASVTAAHILWSELVIAPLLKAVVLETIHDVFAL